MRVVEATVPTSCAIMSEDKNLNGSDVGCSSKKTGELSHSPGSETGEASYSSGGRLKFFKDGKFILELSHRKDGEKECWIPVPKKSFWHPGVANSTASLSASDDTSSVQLSPWQRDHCWKQTAPRRLRGPQLTFRMSPLPAAWHARDSHRAIIRRLRRRPFDVLSLPVASANGSIRPPNRSKHIGSSPRLAALVQRLWDIAKSSPCVFSPRKRILREMERVSLVAEEPVKRQRPRAPPVANHGKGVSNHSISSLLRPREEEPSPFLRTLLRSPSPKSRQLSPVPEPFNPVPPPYMFFPYQSMVPHHSYYMAGSPSHSLWANYPVSSLPRGAGGPYTGPTPPPPPPTYSSPHFQYPWTASPDCETKRDDTASDVPLNLSKHGGG